jgi:hypothetical protein
MALLLKHQTAAQFVARFREAYRNSERERCVQLGKFVIARIQSGDLTETQVRNACGLTTSHYGVEHAASGGGRIVMPITSHLKEESIQANGSKHVVLRMYDQDGREYMLSFFAAAGVDVDTIVTGRIAETDEQLAQAEFEALVGAE